MTQSTLAPRHTATPKMTARERWQSALDCQAVDRLPFWPKIFGSYGKAQPEPFRSMGSEALHAWIGSDRHCGIASCFEEVHQTCSSHTDSTGNTRTTTYQTPAGSLRAVACYDAPSDSWHPTEFPVKTREDLSRMRQFYADTRIVLSPRAQQEALAAQRALGTGASTHSGIGQSALMRFVEWLAGVENAHLLLADYPDEVEALFTEMQRVLLDKTRIEVQYSPADMHYFIENTSTTLISPAQYRRYCLPHLRQCASLAREAPHRIVLHMCGHLKALLPDLEQLPVAAFEAFTSPSLGNTSLLDGRSKCPSKCLVGGTNAVLWLEPAATIIAALKRDLDDLPHHRGIVVTSAGVMPPACSPHTIREVAEWVKAYPARM